MLGRHHLTLSVTTVSAIVLPFLPISEIAVMSVLIGVSVGSLIPDVDAEDATIFHSEVSGLTGTAGKIVNWFVGPLLPVFGYTTKYLIFMPAIILFDNLFTDYSFNGDHREFTHSLLGVVTMTVATGVYMVFILSFTGLHDFSILMLFLAGYGLGAILHMLEDSTTKSGVRWNSPFSSLRLSGTISTGEDNSKPRLMLYLLGGISLTTFYTSISGKAPPLQSSTAGTLLVTMLWLFFLGAVDVKSSR